MEVVMQFVRIVFVSATLIVFVLASACAPNTPATTTNNTPEPTTNAGVVEPQFADFNANNFENSTVIDNEWMPMQPGTRWVLEGKALDDEGQSITRIDHYRPYQSDRRSAHGRCVDR
jgi:hypothetical protein